MYPKEVLGMKTQRLELVFPEKLIKKPIIYQLVKEYDVIPNIRRASVDETFGQIIMELSGEDENLERAYEFLREIGVEIEFLDSFVE
jgi:ABC-type methionine transport system ATPase subunit